MEIPKTIDIGGCEFKIVYPYQFTERSDIDGRIDFGLGHIRIGDRDGLASKDHIETVLLHELTHAISHIYCMDKVGAALEEECVEEVVDAFARGLHQVLKDNFEPLVSKRKKK